MIRPGKANKNIWLNQHKCLICGAFLDVVTHAHAENHGYKNREEFIRSGQVKPLTDRRAKDGEII